MPVEDGEEHGIQRKRYRLDDGRYVDIGATDGYMLLAMRELLAEIEGGIHKMNPDTLGMQWFELALKVGNLNIPQEGTK